MNRHHDRSRTAGVLAAAGLVLLAGCTHPTTTPAGPARSGPSLSAASSTPTPTDPSSTAATATGQGDPRQSLNPTAAASTSPYPHGRAGVPAGGLPAAATRTSPNPLVVAQAALRVLYGSDTTLDTQPMDAEKRALPWLGGRFAAAVADAQIVAAPGAAWNGWAAHHAHLVVSVARGYDDGAPPNTPTTTHQQWVVTQTPVGITGTKPWTGPPVQTVVLIQLTRTGGRWQLTQLLEEH